MSCTIDFDQLLSNKEAARLLGIQPNTLEIWRVQGKGPAFLKLGDRPQSTVRYLRSTVIAWAAQRVYNSTSAYKGITESGAHRG
jgi:predicted DNA-binding transcriptional regulator AlpA